jgi:4,5-dihydroxyphthalate decarboxylase
VRGILADEYGVDLNKVEWITFEDPHVAEYRDPPIVKRAPAGKELAQMLLDGEIDAAVVGDKLPDPRLKHLIADHEAAAQRWAQQHHGIPINHMVVVRSELSKSRPDVVKEVFRLLVESKNAAGAPKNPEPLRFGVEACRPVLETIIDYCYKQGLIPARLSVDSLFDDVTRKLSA